MEITKCEVIPLLIPIESSQLWGLGTTSYYSRMIILIHTDEGYIGLGEIRGEEERKTAFEVISKKIIGENPFNLSKMKQIIAKPQLVKVIGLNINRIYCAIETACLDIQGKVLKRPVYDLLGGKYRNKIPFAAYLFYTRKNKDGSGREVLTPEQMVNYCKDLTNEYGFNSFKLKSGVLDTEIEINTIKEIRKEFPNANIRMDPNAKWNISTSLKVAQQLKETNLEYLEDPTNGIDGMSAINSKLPWISLATNMCVRSFEDIPYAIERRAIDIILADPHEFGGLKAVLELNKICEVFNFDINLHSPQEFGIAMASYLHLAAALPTLGKNYDLDSHYHRLKDDIISRGMFKYNNGYIDVPEGPGLGIQLDMDKVNKYHSLYKKIGGFSPYFSQPRK